MTRVLEVYLKDKYVGELQQSEAGGYIFTYDEEYLETSDIGISISLPLQSEPFIGKAVKAFFSGLLPDETVRERLAAYLGLSEQNTFSLLEAVGGDCAGALALYPVGQKPEKQVYKAEVLDEENLKNVLDLIKRRPMLAGDDDYRLSLAGAQNKLAVGFKDGKVLLIKGGAPTTHILKPVIERVKDSTHNELFCMRLAALVGLDAPNTSLHYVGHTPYYLIERYDRIYLENGSVERVHQEDFCQALAIAPEMKYEKEGGPGLGECQELIKLYAAKPALEQIKFTNILIFNYLIGNADAHAKNFSLLYNAKKPRLAPVYDLLSTIIYPDLSKKMAMAIGGQNKLDYIGMRHFERIVPDTKVARSLIKKQVLNMAKDLVAKAEALRDSLKAEEIVSPVFEQIIQVIEKQRAQLNF
ncbi:MAG: type II toxin-antitoxin system HipA family toxin [Candidatus Caenarcaniphilales bacterium]|nr:type II toxin-antitoxin system HipA family toxin [Candidatus Caenarcaniphilales bacterium]